MRTRLHVTYFITIQEPCNISTSLLDGYLALLHYGCTQQEQFRLALLILVCSGFNIIPAIKRIMQEARELANDPCTDYSAAPLEVGSFSIGL